MCVKQAHQDSYELIRRFAVEYICKNGSNELIPAFVHSILWDNTSERVAFKQRNFMELLELDKVKTEIEKQTSDCPFYNKKEVEEWLDFIDKNRKIIRKEHGNHYRKRYFCNSQGKKTGVERLSQ